MTKTLLYTILFSLFILPIQAAPIVVTNENFETAATGWNVTTREYDASLSYFLGRFGGTGGAQSVYKTFTLAAPSIVTIQFDFYEIDSWDGEQFRVFINDAVVIAAPIRQSYNDSVTNAVALTDGLSHIAYSSGWTDQKFRFTLTYDATTTNLKLGFGSTLDQAIADEAWGIDNLMITANAPEPTTWLLCCFGLVGIVIRKIRK